MGLSWCRRRAPPFAHRGRDRREGGEGAVTRRHSSRAANSPSLLAVSLRALYFAGFSIGNNARTPTVVRERSGESISGEAPRLKGNLTRTYRRRGLAPRLFFVRRGEESHSSSFRDCHKGSAWQTVAHHLLGKKPKLCQMKCTV